MTICSWYVPDVVCIAFVYQTNVDLYLPHQHADRSSMHHFSHTGSTQMVDCLAPLWESRRKVFFPKTQ